MLYFFALNFQIKCFYHVFNFINFKMRFLKLYAYLFFLIFLSGFKYIYINFYNQFRVKSIASPEYIVQ